jgi:hypothetical protein
VFSEATVKQFESERSSRRDPFGWLVCDGGNPIEVFVIVENGNPSGLGCGGDKEISNRDATVMKPAGMCESLLDIASPPENPSIDCRLIEAGKVEGSGVVLLRALGAEEHFERDLITHDDCVTED